VKEVVIAVKKFFKKFTDSTNPRTDFFIVLGVFLTPFIFILFTGTLGSGALAFLVAVQTLCLFCVLSNQSKLNKNFEKEWKSLKEKYF
jgi:Flp pilus assembly protein TadB